MKDNIAISVRNVSKKFRLFSSSQERLAEALHPFRKRYHREFWALKEISFDVYRGEIVGIMGRNGSGKSTLLQLICYIMRTSQGEIRVNGRISALLELGAGFNPEFTGRENIILNGAIMGFTRTEMLRRVPEIEEFADIGEFFDQPVKTYSSGMFVRVAFAAAIHVDPDILIVDEALSVGDAAFQHRCFQRIRSFMEQGKTILVVSHNTDTLLRICHRGVVLDAGKICHIGTISSAVSYYTALLYSKTKAIGIDSKPLEICKQNSAVASNAQIGSLNKEITDKIVEKPNYNKHETRVGTGAVKIIDFDLIVEDQVNPSEIESHKDVQLYIKFLFNEDLNDVYLGVAILSIDGTYIFGTHSELLNMPPFSASAGECVVAKLSWKSHIAGGEKFLSLGCHHFIGGEKRFLDVRRSVAILKFTETPASNGFVDLEVRHEIIYL